MCDYQKVPREHLTQLMLQYSARVDMDFVKFIEISALMTLCDSLRLQEGYQRLLRRSETHQVRRNLRDELEKLLVIREKKNFALKTQMQSSLQDLDRKQLDVHSHILAQREKRKELLIEIELLTRDIEKTDLRKLKYIQMMAIRFPLVKKHFQIYKWAVVRDAKGTMIIQIPRVRLYFDVIHEDRDVSRTIELRKVIEGPYDFLDSHMIDISTASRFEPY
jgi:hypothetical protein